MFVACVEKKLLLALLAIYFFTVAASVCAGIAGGRQPAIHSIDFFEAVKIAKGLLPGRKPAEYENLEFEIIVARKSTTWGRPSHSEYELSVLTDMLDEVYARERSDYSEYLEETHKKLDGRIYWFIYFVPVGQDVGGGGVGFFIDAATSELIEVYRDG